MKKITQHNILDFWFGDAMTIDAPDEERTELWFGLDVEVNPHDLRWVEQCFSDAMDGKLDDCLDSPRGRLAVVVALSQFPRLIYPDTAMLFAGDSRALDICIDGINNGQAQELSLIERAFYFMPLQLSEDMELQNEALRIYQHLNDITLSEVSHLYTAFYQLAKINYDTITKFGRFPQRNVLFERESSDEEAQFLSELS